MGTPIERISPEMMYSWKEDRDRDAEAFAQIYTADF